MISLICHARSSLLSPPSHRTVLCLVCLFSEQGLEDGSSLHPAVVLGKSRRAFWTQQQQETSVVVWPEEGDLGKTAFKPHTPSFVASHKYKIRINHPVTFEAGIFINYKGNSFSDSWQSPYGI